MQQKHVNIFFLVFAMSGFSGLIYESIWTHYLKLFLGHAAYAQTLVLAIFMGGMALGSWLSSKYSVRWRNLFLGYAIAEALIGLFALIFHDVFEGMTSLSYSYVMPNLATSITVNAFKWLASTLIILPQTILLGMTFPLMTAAIVRSFPKNPGKSIGILYFTNSIGAAIGVLVSGFIFISLLGLPGTIRVAGIINILIALIVWLYSRSYKDEPQCIKVEIDKGALEPNIKWYRFLLFASFITGTASFIYEIGWIRMLNLVLGTSTHAFELMLSSFIFGLAFGGLWIQRRIDKIKNPLSFIANVQIIMGLLALSTILFYGNTFEVMRWIVGSLDKTDAGYAIFNLSSNAIALAVMLPTTFCAGMTLPLITYILLKRGYGEKSIGAVYAANTVGAIVGVFFAIHFAMPVLGLKGLIIFGAGLDIALGLSILVAVSVKYGNYRWPALVTAVCICIMAGITGLVRLDPYKMATGVYRDSDFLTSENSELIYHKDGKTATVSIVKMPGGLMNIRTNGKVDAAIVMDPTKRPSMDKATMVQLAVIPMMLKPEAKTVANIGLGSGLTTHTFLQNPLIQVVDTIEIERNMVDAARHFGSQVENVYNDPRSKIHIDDAKTFFAAHNKKYDIIISEPSNPWVSGVASLFTEEFYHQVGHHLSDRGVFAQWVQLYEIDSNLVASVLKAVSSSFTDFEVYALDAVDLLIVAKNGSKLGKLESSIFDNPEIAETLKKIYVESAQDIEFRKIGDRGLFDMLLKTFPLSANSDYYPFLDQNAAKARFMEANAMDLYSFTHQQLPVSSILMGEVNFPETTDITPTRFFPKSESAYQAMALRDYFLQGVFLPKYIVPVSTKKDAMLLKEFFNARDEGAGAGAGEAKAIIALFNTAVRVLPYLSPDEMAKIWNALELRDSNIEFSSKLNQWIALFKSIGSRDGKRMTYNAKSLLENEKNLPSNAIDYLIVTAMLGSVSEGDLNEASNIWARYGSNRAVNEKNRMLFRLLSAYGQKA